MIFLLWWAFNILTAKKPVEKIAGVVMSKSDTSINVMKSDGSVVVVPIVDFDVGDKVFISVHKSEITGKTEYRYFKAKSFGVAGE